MKTKVLCYYNVALYYQLEDNGFTQILNTVYADLNEAMNAAEYEVDHEDIFTSCGKKDWHFHGNGSITMKLHLEEYPETCFVEAIVTPVKLQPVDSRLVAISARIYYAMILLGLIATSFTALSFYTMFERYVIQH